MEKKRISGIRVLFMLLMLLLVFPTSAQAAKISKKKAVVFAGQSFKLKMKGIGKKKVSWSSSDKTVASVTKKGKVKAKKPGKATITAKVGKKKYKCKVTVKRVLKVKPKSITIGKSGSIACWLYAEKAEIFESVKNASIVEAEFADDWDGDKILLNLKGLKNGKTKITISNSMNDESYTVTVTVTGLGK